MSGLKDALRDVSPKPIDNAPDFQHSESSARFEDNSLPPLTDEDRLLSRIESVELETIIGGALMRVRFKRGTNPVDVKRYLTELDANAKVRDEWPMRPGGRRETKSATALTVTIDAKGDYKRISIVCTGETDVTVEVSKKYVDEFLPKLIALNKLTEANATKASKAFEDKKTATLILGEAERFGVKYSDFEGKCYLEELTADAPVAKETT